MTALSAAIGGAQPSVAGVIDAVDELEIDFRRLGDRLRGAATASRLHIPELLDPTVGIAPAKARIDGDGLMTDARVRHHREPPGAAAEPRCPL